MTNNNVKKTRPVQTSVGIGKADFDDLRKACPDLSALSNTALVQYCFGYVRHRLSSPVAQNPVVYAVPQPAQIVSNVEDAPDVSKRKKFDFGDEEETY